MRPARDGRPGQPFVSRIEDWAASGKMPDGLAEDIPRSVLLQFLRTAGAQAWMKGYSDAAAGEVRPELASLFGAAIEDDDTKRMLPVLNMGLMLGRIPLYAEWWLRGYEWALARAIPGGVFHTSDNPVAVMGRRSAVGIGKRGFAIPNTCVHYPITPVLSISGYNGGHAFAGRVFTATGEYVSDSNRAEAIGAARWVLSSRDDLV